MKIIVIGAGPAGMMACIQASKNKQNNVLLIEKNATVGKKLNITGKGRCNITYQGNDDYFLSNIVTNSKFLIKSINAFSNIDLIKFTNSLGIKTKNERGNRVFLQSDNAKELTHKLEQLIQKSNVKILKNTIVKNINVDRSKVVGVIIESGELLKADKIIIATGGKSYPLTGSTGDGYKFAKEIGHNIIKPKAALVPLKLLEKEICVALEGLTLKNVKIKIKKMEKTKIKTLYEEFGEVMFTKKGITGPIAISLSSKLNNVKYLNEMIFQKIKIMIDLKPALSDKELYNRITKDFEKHKNKEYKNSLIDLLPTTIIPVIVALSKIDKNKKVNSITKKEKQYLVNLLKNLTFTLEGLEDISVGIVTSGGINVGEINPSTMESKIISGLYFAGEVLDVDAYTGGFNLQIAFSTGFIAGKMAGGIIE